MNTMVDLSFKVPAEWHQAFKRAAVDKCISMTALLKLCFDAWRSSEIPGDIPLLSREQLAIEQVSEAERTIQMKEPTLSELASFVSRRLAVLRATKSLDEIANDAGLKTPNLLTLMAEGTVKMPLDRVVAYANALQCSPRELMRHAARQYLSDDNINLIVEAFSE